MRTKLVLGIIATLCIGALTFVFMRSEHYRIVVSNIKSLRKTQLIGKEKKMAQDFQLNVQTLDNNRVWYVTHKDTDLICFELIFKRSGYIYEHIAGLTSVLENMLMEGAGEYTSREFKEYLLNNQIQLGIAADEDDFFIKIRTTRDNLQNSVEVIKLILTQLRLDMNDLERIKNQAVQSLLQKKHSPRSIAKEQIQQFLFKKHPMFKTNDELIEGIQKIESEDLKNHIKNFFTQDYLKAVFVGNIEKEEIDNAFNAIKNVLPERSQRIEIPQVEFQNLGEIKTHYLDIPQSVVLFVMPSIARTHPDFYKLMVFNMALGSMSYKNRLWDAIRENSGLAYTIGSTLSTSSVVNTLEGETSADTANVDRVISLIQDEITKAIERGITQEELDLIKKFFYGTIDEEFDSILSITNKLSVYLSIDLPPNFINERKSIVRKMTLQEINDAAKKHLNAKDIAITIVGRNSNKNDI